MVPRRLVLCFSMLLAGASPVLAAPDMVELIPEDAAFAIMVPSLNDLKQKGDTFLKEIESAQQGGFTQAVSFVTMILNINGVVDEKRPFGLVIGNPKKTGVDLQRFPNDDPGIALLVPYADVNKLATNMGVAVDDIKPGKVIPLKDRQLKFMVVNDRTKYAYMGLSDKAVSAIAQGKSLSTVLPEQQQKDLARMDLLVHIHPVVWGDIWQRAIKDMEDDFASRPAGKTESVRQLIVALRKLHRGSLTFQLDKGLHVRFHTAFDDDEKKSVQTFLTTLQGGQGRANLTGLPAGKLLYVQGAKGDGSKNGSLARELLQFILAETAVPTEVFDRAEASNVVAAFSRVWHLLRGSRVGVYLNDQPSRVGLMSLVAVLETPNPDRFLDDLLVNVGKGESDKLQLNLPTDRPEDVKVINKLIGDLASDDFTVREGATKGLREMGRQALPYLEKAQASTDPEVRRRATELVREMRQGVGELGKDLLSGRLRALLRPEFVRYSKAEMRKGVAVDVIQVKLKEADEVLPIQLRGLLGPNWDKIRFAVQGENVVMLLGSNVELFDQTLANLQTNKPGLEATASLKSSYTHIDPDRRVEMHFSIQRIYAMIAEFDPTLPAMSDPGDDLTTFSLSVEANQLQVDAWLPSSELKRIAKVFGP